MSRKNKLRKFAEVLAFPNVFECYNVQQPALVGQNMEPLDWRGQWKSGYFKNENPLTLELACGGGEYAVELGRRYPDRNFIGMDVKGNRLWKGAKTALTEGLHNVAFVRTRIEIIEHFFARDEVDEIWITFPDPFPQHGKSNRRLTSTYFLEKYRQILKPGGLMHLKHDNPDFFKFSLKTIAQDPRCRLLYANEDIYAAPFDFPELGIQTLYESKHLQDGRKIKYAQFLIG